jgi:uncharacterized MAPEG superfamily protein
MWYSKGVAMTIPLWTLLGFAVWTLLLLIAGVGVIRWSHILKGDMSLNEYWKALERGSPLYKRVVRVHANCVENLPIYTAIVVVLTAAHLTSATIDKLAITFFAARLIQSTIHFCFRQTTLWITLRFCFFTLQIICMGWLAGIIVMNAA